MVYKLPGTCLLILQLLSKCPLSDRNNALAIDMDKDLENGRSIDNISNTNRVLEQSEVEVKLTEITNQTLITTSEIPPYCFSFFACSTR